MRHTEPDYYHSEPSMGCLIGLSITAALAVLGFGVYELGGLAIQLIHNHFNF
ncbi:MAG: hypothetical protein ACRYFZ_00640 [Janthinobacterium lividum]